MTLLDRKKVGLNTQIFAEVKLNAHGRSNFTEFTEAIRGFPQVLECYVLMGSVDFLLRIVTPDIEAYERFFFEKLSNVPGIRKSIDRGPVRNQIHHQPAVIEVKRSQGNPRSQGCAKPGSAPYL